MDVNEIERAQFPDYVRRYKGTDELVRQKLEKWKGKTALQWNWLPGGTS